MRIMTLQNKSCRGWCFYDTYRSKDQRVKWLEIQTSGTRCRLLQINNTAYLKILPLAEIICKHQWPARLSLVSRYGVGSLIYKKKKNVRIMYRPVLHLWGEMLILKLGISKWGLTHITCGICSFKHCSKINHYKIISPKCWMGKQR